MTPKLYLILYLFTLSAAAEVQESTHIVWQGFSHKWERSSMLMSYLHPLGSIQSTIIEEAPSDASATPNSLSANIDFKFSPGD